MPEMGSLSMSLLVELSDIEKALAHAAASLLSFQGARYEIGETGVLVGVVQDVIGNPITHVWSDEDDVAYSEYTEKINMPVVWALLESLDIENICINPFKSREYLHGIALENV